MTTIKPFRAIRPHEKFVDQVAALPYDVYSRQEAREFVKDRPYSFLNIDRPETQFDPEHDMYAQDVYEKARDMIVAQMDKGIYIQDPQDCFYIYEQTMNGRIQTGLAAVSSIDDYLNGICKKHENTVSAKETDRIHHVSITSCQTGPIFLTYRKDETIQAMIESQKERKPVYDFTSEDGVHQRVWVINDRQCVKNMEDAFKKVPNTYIADGHHRCASAVRVGCQRRQQYPDHTGQEEFNYFLCILFPDTQLEIMDYNRFVSDLNGLSFDEYMNKLSEVCTITPISQKQHPEHKKQVTMVTKEGWYKLDFNKISVDETDVVARLDVSRLQQQVLGPILGINDPRTDPRISFIGGIRGLEELEKRVQESAQASVAFAMVPTDISELMDVADAGRLMPPKSTWFEPKLRSGLFIHPIETEK